MDRWTGTGKEGERERSGKRTRVGKIGFMPSDLIGGVFLPFAELLHVVGQDGLGAFGGHGACCFCHFLFFLSMTGLSFDVQRVHSGCWMFDWDCQKEILVDLVLVQGRCGGLRYPTSSSGQTRHDIYLPFPRPRDWMTSVPASCPPVFVLLETDRIPVLMKIALFSQGEDGLTFDVIRGPSWRRVLSTTTRLPFGRVDW